MKKDQIHNAVMSIIEDKGLSKDITVSEIANKAGIGKGTVYEYFSSKEEVIESTILYFIQKTMDANSDFNVYNNLSFKESIYLYMNTISNIIHKDPFVYSLMNNLEETAFSKDFKIKIEKEMKIANERSREAFNYIVKKGIEEKIINKPNEFEIQSIIIYINMTLFKSMVFNMFDEKQLLDNIYKMAIKMMI